MLKSRGLSMDPWGTPYSKSVQVLYVPFTIMWYIVVYIFREREVFWGNYVSNTIQKLKKNFSSISGAPWSHKNENYGSKSLSN